MNTSALEVEDAFFDALRRGDAASLADLLVEDFVIVDVMSGGENSGEALVGGIQAGVVVFETVDVLERRVREYGDCAIVVGSTKMRGRFGGAAFTAHSRYTHVIVNRGDGWRIASAQGTPIAA
jgi:ketosteroid isomerase-like protein